MTATSTAFAALLALTSAALGCDRRPAQPAAPEASLVPAQRASPPPEVSAAEITRALEQGIAAASAQTQARMDQGETFGGSEGVPCVEALVAGRHAAAATIERALREGRSAPADASGALVACRASREITTALSLLQNGASQAVNVAGPGASERAHCDEPAVPVPPALTAALAALAARCP